MLFLRIKKAYPFQGQGRQNMDYKEDLLLYVENYKRLKSSCKEKFTIFQKINNLSFY